MTKVWTLDDFIRRGDGLFCPEPAGHSFGACRGHTEDRAASVAEIATFGEYPRLTCIAHGSLMVQIIRRIQALEAK